MDVEKILRLKDERNQKIARCRALVDRADIEKRSMSRREQPEYDRLIREINDIDDQIRAAGGSFDPRQVQGDSRRLGEAPEAAVALGPEQRMGDWLAARGDGLTSELEEFSLGKAVRGALTGNWAGADVERRVMAEGTDAVGGYLIPAPLSARLIDRIRHISRVFEAGVSLVPMTVDELSLARLETPGSASWKTENNPITTTDLTFGKVTLKAKTLPILARMSRELFDDMSDDAAALIERELLSVLALEVDRAVLRGSGVDPEPKGIRNQTGVNVTTLGTGNGAALTGYDEVVDAMTRIREDNLEPNAILWAPRTVGFFDKLKISSGEAYPIPPSVQGVRRLATNQIPTNLTVGSKSDATEIYVGQWNQCLVGMRTNLRVGLQKLVERYSDNLQIGLLGYVRCDVAIAHPEAFEVIAGVRPAGA